MARAKGAGKATVALRSARLSAADVLADYRLAAVSRQASLIGRREVMSGKAKFGIFGDGKEVPQVALARAFRPGDFRSGYYRDQTLVFALAGADVAQFFAQLYAHADVDYDPMSAGRSMNSHFATRSLHPDGRWRSLTATCNLAADLSPTGAQMPKLVGLAYASVLYRHLDGLDDMTDFSRGGDEVAFGTIGNATCAEGLFWESVNAIGVLGAPAVISIWDDGYGISVPSAEQVSGGDIGALLAGFQRRDGGRGFEIRVVPGWDYPVLVDTYHEVAELARREHVPSIVHVTELTQPQGHSTSGSHERYKSKDRLAWEREFDCLYKMRQWIVNQGIATMGDMDRIDDETQEEVERTRARAWEAFQAPMRDERDRVVGLIRALAASGAPEVATVADRLAAIGAPWRRDAQAAAHEVLFVTRGRPLPARSELAAWRAGQDADNVRRFGSHLIGESTASPLLVPEVRPEYGADAPELNGFEILNASFDEILSRDRRVVAFGEDVGRLGDVNQGFRGLQEVHGALRVADTGIREATILGQAIGLALRGLRPIAEIQYLDYLLYALQLMSDDLATLHWRTRGGQKAPVIVRTRGHRLEGTWHAGSPMAGIIHLVRGVHVCVPRDMTRAAGFYHTLLAGDDPGLVVEVLSGYRLKERLPANLDRVTVPLGVPEVLRPGRDVTVVTYGACCRIVLAAAARLAEAGIEVEVIDVQTLLPFDRPGTIGESLRRTGRVLFVDEDVPGGATAYMLQQVVERQGGYYDLDAPPRTLPAAEHRTAYGTDGDYWSKPNVESVTAAIYDLVSEADPDAFPPYLDVE